MSKLKLIFLCLALILVVNPMAYAQPDEIVVGTMNRAKNLNPYMARSEIELALQTVVFPPLIADFIEERRGGKDSFQGILIPNRSIIQRRGTNYLEFDLQGSGISPAIFIENFSRVRSLGPKSNFSWNLNRVEHLENQRVKVYFDKSYSLGKLIASTFPQVDFNTIDGEWERSDQVFITDSDRPLLKGFSDYQYSQIDPQRSIIRLTPKITAAGKDLVVKTFPDYNQLINQLNAGELQVAFNLSALTRIHNPDIIYDDMKFANQYILYMVVTPKGRNRGLADMGIINHVRGKFKDAFPGDRVLLNSGNVFIRDGFLLETAQLPRSQTISRLSDTSTITMLYYRNTINDRVKDMIEGVFANMNYPFRAVAIDQNTSKYKYYENDFDLVMKSQYIQFPEFLNLKYYEELMDYYPMLQSRGYKRRINGLLSRGGRLSQLHEEARNMEQEILKNLPVVFLIRYNTRIAVKNNIQNYRGRGVPYFFYNLSGW